LVSFCLMWLAFFCCAHPNFPHLRYLSGAQAAATPPLSGPGPHLHLISGFRSLFFFQFIQLFDSRPGTFFFDPRFQSVCFFFPGFSGHRTPPLGILSFELFNTRLQPFFSESLPWSCPAFASYFFPTFPIPSFCFALVPAASKLPMASDPFAIGQTQLCSGSRRIFFRDSRIAYCPLLPRAPFPGPTNRSRRSFLNDCLQSRSHLLYCVKPFLRPFVPLWGTGGWSTLAVPRLFGFLLFCLKFVFPSPLHPSSPQTLSLLTSSWSIAGFFYLVCLE